MCPHVPKNKRCYWLGIFLKYYFYKAPIIKKINAFKHTQENNHWRTKLESLFCGYCKATYSHYKVKDY